MTIYAKSFLGHNPLGPTGYVCDWIHNKTCPSDWAVTDVTVNWAGHTFHTCNVITSTNQVWLKANSSSSAFCFMRQKRHCQIYMQLLTQSWH